MVMILGELRWNTPSEYCLKKIFNNINEVASARPARCHTLYALPPERPSARPVPVPLVRGGDQAPSPCHDAVLMGGTHDQPEL